MLKNVIKRIDEKPAAKLFFILLFASLVIVPALVFIYTYDVISDVDNFIDKEFKGAKITAIQELERPNSRGRYRRIEVDGQVSPTYPILITDINADTSLAVGQTIWKDSKSSQFKIRREGTEINFELSDQRKSRRIELIVVMIIAVGLFGFLTFLSLVVSK
jgi:hypothetical protein